MTFRSTILPAAGILLLSGCAGTAVLTPRENPEFPRENLRTASLVLVGTPKARVTAFQIATAKVYGAHDSLPAFLLRALADSLNAGSPRIAATRAPFEAPPDDVELSDLRGLDSAARATGARYVLRIRDVSVSDSLRTLPTVLTPGTGGTAWAGGGTSESCVVRFDVEVWETEGPFARRYAFTVSGRADVTLYAYKTAVKNAVRAALKNTVRHLRG